jgi:hypothetical protein
MVNWVGRQGSLRFSVEEWIFRPWLQLTHWHPPVGPDLIKALNPGFIDDRPISPVLDEGGDVRHVRRPGVEPSSHDGVEAVAGDAGH